MNIRTQFSVVVCFIATLLAGCTTVTPLDRATVYYDRANFLQQAENDVGIPANEVIQHGRCVALLATPGTNMAPQHFCVYALERSALHVLQWNLTKVRYEKIYEVNFSKVKEVGLISFLRTNQMQLVEDLRLLGMSAIIDAGGYYDTKATESMFNVIVDFGVNRFEPKGRIIPPAAPAVGVMPIPIIIPRR